MESLLECPDYVCGNDCNAMIKQGLSRATTRRPYRSHTPSDARLQLIMFVLYSGGGSGEIDLQGQVSSGLWDLVRKRAINYLVHSGSRGAAELLKELPF